MKNNIKRKMNVFANLKDLVCDCYYESKIKFFITGFVMLVALLTGIIFAIKCFSGTGDVFNKYGVVDLSNGLSSSFFSRLFSMILVMLLLFGFSFTKFCMPLALILIGYRTYLLGLNLTIMFICFGVPGMIVSIIIALPCQILALASLCIFYMLQCKCSRDFNCCGREHMRRKLQLMLFCLVLLLIICILETLLLLLLSAKVILVI